MGLRFRRAVKILPGIRLNFSRSGISTSVGVRGAHVTVGKDGIRSTVGIPGTGLSYTEVQGGKRSPGATRGTVGTIFGWLILVLFLIVVFVIVLNIAGVFVT